MPIDHRLLHELLDAVAHMESLGSRLTVFSSFGTDPLEGREDLISQREAMFSAKYPDFGPFFYSAVNGDYTLSSEKVFYTSLKLADNWNVNSKL